MPSHTEAVGTDDELSALLHALRRHLTEARDAGWDDDTMTAARHLAAAISAHLGAPGA